MAAAAHAVMPINDLKRALLEAQVVAPTRLTARQGQQSSFVGRRRAMVSP